jgi:hypothetical protein
MYTSEGLTYLIEVATKRCAVATVSKRCGVAK